MKLQLPDYLITIFFRHELLLDSLVRDCSFADQCVLRNAGFLNVFRFYIQKIIGYETCQGSIFKTFPLILYAINRHVALPVRRLKRRLALGVAVPAVSFTESRIYQARQALGRLKGFLLVSPRIIDHL